MKGSFQDLAASIRGNRFTSFVLLVCKSMEEEEDCPRLIVDCFCTNTKKNEKCTVTFDGARQLSQTSVLEFKHMLQDLLNVPVCLQELSFLGQTLNNPEMMLSELYIRRGETLCLEYLDKVDIKKCNDCLVLLKQFETLLSQLCSSDGSNICVPHISDVEKVEDLYADVLEQLEYLSNVFGSWKSVQVQAERRYFVQENGLHFLMEIHALSIKEYTWFCQAMREDLPSVMVESITNNEDEFMSNDELVITFNKWQLDLNSLILKVLWNFMETGPETQLVLQHGGLKIMVDAYLRCHKDIVFEDVYETSEEVHVSALGCLCGVIECDKGAQRKVAADHRILDKFTDVICGRKQNNTHDFSAEHRCLVANALFYLTFDQKALKSMVDYRLHLKILVSNQNLLKFPAILDLSQVMFSATDERSRAIIVCYYCILFLARIRSSTLVSIPLSHGLHFDFYFEQFLKSKVTPKKIAQYEEDYGYVWMTLTPILHLAFARGNLNPGDESNNVVMFEEEEMECRESGSEDELDDISFIDGSSSNAQLFNESLEASLACELSYNVEWPGSCFVQEIGLFALHHVLESEHNVKLLTSGNQHSYLVCLLWQLEGRSRQGLKNLLKLNSLMHVPSLGIICKSVLAKKIGLDGVRDY